MIFEMGTIAGVGLLVFGAVALSNAEKSQRQKEKADRSKASDLLYKTLCPACGGFNWDTSYFQGYCYGIRCGNCSLYLGSQTDFLRWKSGDKDISDDVEHCKEVIDMSSRTPFPVLDKKDLDRQVERFMFHNCEILTEPRKATEGGE